MGNRDATTPALPFRVRAAVADCEPSERPTLTDGLESAGPSERTCQSLTLLSGRNAGRFIELGTDELVFGRGEEGDSDPTLSRRHARFFAVGEHAYVEDLGSTNGTFVRGARIGTPVALRDGDQIQLGARTLLRYSLASAAEQQAALQVYEQAVRDPGSGAYNRRYFDQRLRSERAYAERHGTALSLLVIDVDGFKSVNDAFGHVHGDSVLRVLAASIQRLLRPADTLVRYGGDEFVVLCRDTNVRNAMILAERVRAAVQHLVFASSGNEFRITVSIGVAGGRSHEAVASSLLESADRAMYRAKHAGRNGIAD